MSTTATLAVAEARGPKWRAEPYRLLFPLGGLLAWAGVLHWLLLATGAIDDYRSTFHAITQIQGLMTCFGVGFLFTFIPRRTGGEPARAWQIAVAVAAPIATTAFAWFELWVPSQACWVALIQWSKPSGRPTASIAERRKRAQERSPTRRQDQRCDEKHNDRGEHL